MSIIRKAREDKQLSRPKLAEKLGVTEITIVRWENKTHAPKLKDLPNIYKHLGLTYNKVVNDYIK